MSAAIAERSPEPEVLHSIPGRMRLRLPNWSGVGPTAIERRLRAVPGVRAARANPTTGNVLVLFDPRAAPTEAILAAARDLGSDRGGTETATVALVPAGPPAAQVDWTDRRGPSRRARIALPGLDRDPALAARVEEHLMRRMGVRARANPLTQRVLVEFERNAATLEDVLADLADLDLPPAPAEEHGFHPAAVEPLARNVARAVGAGLGLALIAARRFASPGRKSGSAQAAEVAALVGIVQSFPVVRQALGRLVGPNAAEVLLGVTGTTSLALAGSPIGLALSGIEGGVAAASATSQRAAWLRLEDAEARAIPARPGAVVHLEAGDRTPLAATVLQGAGVAIAEDGLPTSLAPGRTVSSGARLFGGPFALRLHAPPPVVSGERPAPPPESPFSRYMETIGLGALGYAALTLARTRSLGRALEALLLVNPRPALIGTGMAGAWATMRLGRAGVTVIGTRRDRPLRRPDLLVLDHPRLIADGLEIAGVFPLTDAVTGPEVAAIAAAVARAAGAPWGGAFPASRAEASAGSFDGEAAVADVDGARYELGTPADDEAILAAGRLRERGEQPLLLRRAEDGLPLGVVALRPRLAPSLPALVETCRRRGVEIGLVSGGPAVEAIARRAELPLLPEADALTAVVARQAAGAVVALVSDRADAASGFAACDIAIGLGDVRAQFPARVDLLAPDLGGVAEVVDAGARRDATTRDSVALSLMANVAGAIWGLRRDPGILRASNMVYAAAFAAILDGWLRSRGGEAGRAFVSWVADPRPERWGLMDAPAALRALGSNPAGLGSTEAAQRVAPQRRAVERRPLLDLVLDQIRSPLTGVLAVGAAISLAMGNPIDVALIGGVIVANIVIGAWEERQANRAAAALADLTVPNARVLRDGVPTTVPADSVVRGDILLLSAGDRVSADARLLDASGLEVDEALLTGESMPVVKAPDAAAASDRVVLNGSDVVSGAGRAAVVATGEGTRLGATAAALEVEEPVESALGVRLGQMLRLVMPVAVGGGALVAASGLLRGQPPLGPLSLGTSIAVAAVPEGLPLLARMGEVAVARRLTDRHALVRRLSAVEALGRVDVACVDKTGTLTEGRLRLRVVADLDREADPADPMPDDLRQILLLGALASPRPDAAGAASHPTDVAVVNGAQIHGLGNDLLVDRSSESPFDPRRRFHAATANGKLCVKGAPEAVLDLCDRVRRDGGEQPLDERTRERLIARSQRLAERGLRMLMVASGPSDTPADAPSGLVAHGFLGISDPLKPGVGEAVRRCREAGVRVIMLTGDHPTTARAIGREAGLLESDDEVLNAVEFTQLEPDEIDARLDRANVIARATPLDKQRIVESLRRRGHVVAMTGDGANDGPALRLADAGIAMGRGTEVARQAADVVLTDDEFATMVQALIEGRSFWSNIRRALGLLLGGNLGELGLLVVPSVLGLPAALTTRQILAVNMITDVLPALAVALQPPATRDLAGLAREGTEALEGPLRRDILRRGLATAAPSLAAYLLALMVGGPDGAASIGFASLVTTQLAQTIDLGMADGRPSRSVIGAALASGGLLAAGMVVPPLQAVLGLTAPTPLGWAIVGGSALVAVALNRLLTAVELHAMGIAPAQPAPSLGLAPA